MKILPAGGEVAARSADGGGGKTLRRPETYTARNLRREMSLPEVLLWRELRGRKSGVKFRRQHPIGPYVVDFYCPGAKLVIEIDGIVHDLGDRPERDEQRTGYMAERGYQVARFPAKEVLRDVGGIADSIAALVASPLHHPSDGPPPHAGEDR